MSESITAQLPVLAERSLRVSKAHEPTYAEIARVQHSVLEPLVGRLFRHEALGWAAEIAARRKWSLRLYGRGWDRHSTLGCYAAGPLEHGEALRAAYQGAGVHLHLDPLALTHQRVFECAFSGGLPVARLHADALTPSWNRAEDELFEVGVPTECLPGGARLYRTDSAPLGARLIAEASRVGLKVPEQVTRSATRLVYGRWYRDGLAASFDALALYDGLADVTFSDASSLEALLERSLGDASWRHARSHGMAASMKPVVSTGAFAEAMLDFSARVIGAYDLHLSATGRNTFEPQEWIDYLNQPL